MTGSRSVLLVLPLVAVALAHGASAAPPYAGKPFEDSAYKAGPQRIPGIVQAALYDTGGEGVAYHDSDAINHGSGELNADASHQRPHATAYVWGFRKDEGVDISYVKDFADLNHPNPVSPLVNQLYIGWTADGEWVNYTVEVEAAGRYVVRALYSNEANAVSFDADGRPAGECRLPVPTGHWHTWNYAQIGTVTFPKAGRQVLTFHYGRGNNFAYFAFERAQ
jgi:hypothetical protein